MDLDFNTAEAGGDFTPIPNGTEVPLVMWLVPGHTDCNPGDKLLHLNKAGDKHMIVAEYNVTDGPYKGRKWKEWHVMDGSETAANITRKHIRSVVEASRGIAPNDNSPAAVQARDLRATGLAGALHGAQFNAVVGVDGDWNRIKYVKEASKGGATAAQVQPAGQPAATPAAPAAAPNNLPDWAR